MSWDGKERRGASKDHDVLTRIDVNMTNLLEWFHEHVEDDATNFEALRSRTNRLEKFMWISIGVTVAINFWIKLTR